MSKSRLERLALTFSDDRTCCGCIALTFVAFCLVTFLPLWSWASEGGTGGKLDFPSIFRADEGATLEKLIVFLPGSRAAPEAYEDVCDQLGTGGYACIVLMYNNDNLGLQSACGEDDPPCYRNLLEEIAFGGDKSPHQTVPIAQGVEARLVAAIRSQGDQWSLFLNGNQPNWPLITISGHSQGSQVALFLSYNRQCDRAAIFGGPNFWYDSEEANYLEDEAQERATPAERVSYVVSLYEIVCPAAIKNLKSIGVSIAQTQRWKLDGNLGLLDSSTRLVCLDDEQKSYKILGPGLVAHSYYITSMFTKTDDERLAGAIHRMWRFAIGLEDTGMGIIGSARNVTGDVANGCVCDPGSFYNSGFIVLVVVFYALASTAGCVFCVSVRKLRRRSAQYLKNDQESPHYYYLAGLK